MIKSKFALGATILAVATTMVSGNALATKDSDHAKPGVKTIVEMLEKNGDSPTLLHTLKKERQKYEGIHEKVQATFFKEHFKAIGEDLRNFRLANPSATDEELDEQFIKILDNYEKGSQEKMKSGITADDYDLEDYDIPNLNELEEALFDDYPSKGYHAIAAAVEASDYSVYLFNKTVWPGGKNDAFRHSYWNICIVLLTNDAWAKTWTDAHEYGAVDYYSSNPHVLMDLHNNKEGRYRAAQDGLNFEDHWTDARRSAHTLYKSGKLKYLKNWSIYPDDNTRLYLTSFTGYDSDFVRAPY